MQRMTALRSRGLFAVLLTGLVLAFSSCKKDEDNTPAPPTIYSLISTGNQFTILKKALVKAGLNGPLSQPGNLTVFAPTDAAFRAFGYADTNAINNIPATQVPLLVAVLQYHVIGSKVESSAIPAAVNTPQQTLGGLPLYVTKAASSTTSSATSTSISVNGARVVSLDGQASNGAVHVIDRVLLPPVLGNIAATLQGIPTLFPTYSFTFLQAAVAKAGIGGALIANGPLTVFAPTDAAFTAANPNIKTVEDVNALPAATLAQILSYHVINNARAYTPLITNGQSLTTLQGGTITAATSTTGITVTGRGNNSTASRVIGPDLSATNGVIHVIDRLLLP
ncbi:fasciclin domain-containing protein [Spirosoma taeanense]|uniref:Fasciclin domain-containing protein n=2 Tax=Spirosoma taeanense TaxID=2735870 RepID=A0A6M5YE67_9BACT|nr:fasciclin domain-containing protein [Spirosoma taeanense]